MAEFRHVKRVIVSLWGHRVGMIVPTGLRGESYAFQYDLTGSDFPSNDPWAMHGGDHQLSINGKRSQISDKDLLEVADRFAIGTAERVLKDVKSVVVNRRS